MTEREENEVYQTYKTIIAKVETALINKGLNAAEVAEQIGVSKSYFSMLLNGKAKWPIPSKSKIYDKLSKILEIEQDYFKEELSFIAAYPPKSDVSNIYDGCMEDLSTCFDSLRKVYIPANHKKKLKILKGLEEIATSINNLVEQNKEKK